MRYRLTAVSGHPGLLAIKPEGAGCFDLVEPQRDFHRAIVATGELAISSAEHCVEVFDIVALRTQYRLKIGKHDSVTG
jgi:hypothetical protein